MTPKEIIDLRSQLFISRRKFARLLKVDKKTVDYWEYGKNKPTGERARKLQKLAELAAQPEWQKRMRLSAGITREEIQALRKRLGLTQNQFAAKLMVKPAAVKNWERGKRAPNRRNTERLRALENYLNGDKK